MKKAIKDKEGAFRAAFEDKVLMSDIVFLRGWIPVQPPTLYAPLPNFDVDVLLGLC